MVIIPENGKKQLSKNKQNKTGKPGESKSLPPIFVGKVIQIRTPEGKREQKENREGW